MPAGPNDGFDDDDPLRFMDDDDDFDASDIVDLDGAPHILAMGVSSAVSVDDASAWGRQPNSARAMDACTVDNGDSGRMPVVQASAGDPVDLPDSPFQH